MPPAQGGEVKLRTTSIVGDGQLCEDLVSSAVNNAARGPDLFLDARDGAAVYVK